MRDVCVEQFSQFTDMEIAYAAWHSTNERVINDISKRIKVMAKRKANAEPDRTKRAQVYASYVERPTDIAAARKQLLGKGPDDLLLTCISWGKSALIDVEGDFAAPLATVRRLAAH